ncbi:hypothetical protein DFJ73DRAFT_633636, partial [Zopfochytrium polystomum]
DLGTRSGHVDVVQWWREGTKMTVRRDAVMTATMRGHAAMLAFWLLENGDASVGGGAVSSAAAFPGHVTVLSWCVRSGLELKWSCRAMDRASARGHVQVLRWWKEQSEPSSGSLRLCLKYTKAAIDGARANGHEEFLKWWDASGLLQAPG